jgi:hypothetical protein
VDVVIALIICVTANPNNILQFQPIKRGASPRIHPHQ